MPEIPENFDDSVFVEDYDGIITVRNLEAASIRARLERLPAKVYEYYEKIKNALTTSEKVLNRTYVGKDCFFVDADTVAKFNVVDDELHFYAKVSPAERGKSGHYKTPAHNVDESNVSTMVILKTDGDLRAALDLIYCLKQKYDF